MIRPARPGRNIIYTVSERVGYIMVDINGMYTIYYTAYIVGILEIPSIKYSGIYSGRNTTRQSTVRPRSQKQNLHRPFSQVLQENRTNLQSSYPLVT